VMEFSCAVCGKDSGTSLVCHACLKTLNPNKRLTIMRAWHRIVVERAGNACETCGHSAEFDSGELCGDHIQTQGSRPDLVFDVTNGRSTCLACHNKRHSHGLPKKGKPVEKVKFKKAVCNFPRCIFLPLQNGRCIRHQPE
jgi:hypothetical protein